MKLIGSKHAGGELSKTTPFTPLGLSRRKMLQLGAGGAAALLGQEKIFAQAFKLLAARRGLLRTHRPARAAIDPQVLAVLNRMTFGFSRTAAAEVAATGVDAYLESQLNPALIDDSAADARLTVYDTLTMTSQQISNTYSAMQNVPILQLMESTLVRAVYSKRQLLERMVQFWTDHFNIDITKGVGAFLKTADDRDVIRQNALGTFPDLLNASARSAAMLFYLDNFTNVFGNAQENYARELMELHTLSVDGPFTQQDVQEVARCFTGWTIQDTPNFGQFIFAPSLHDPNAKIVLGQTIPAGGGISDGQTVLDILAMHPSTARFIASKLCIRFLGYDPPEDIVESVKQTYLDTGGDIKSMLRVILRASAVTYLSTPKLKRPFHIAASLLRATDADVMNPLIVVFHLLIMGHAPFLWPRPDGYPDTIGDWGSSLLPRWQYASALFDGAITDTVIDSAALLASENPAPGQEAAAIDSILTGGTLSQAELTQLQQFIDTGTPVSDWFGLAASIPGFQFY